MIPSRPAQLPKTLVAGARHPLAALRHARKWSGQRYLMEVDKHHRLLGYGTTATNRKKISQWESGVVTPEISAQLAIAAVEGIPEEAVHRLGWPDYLLAALGDEYILLSPWTIEGTRHALVEASTQGPIDMRTFLIASGESLVKIVQQWVPVAQDVSSSPSRQHTSNANAIASMRSRLSQLSRLERLLGSGKIRHLAAAELSLVAALITETSHRANVERELYSLASEASWLAGWLSYDSGFHAAAQRYYVAAMRASSAANDVLAGAHVAASMAMQLNSVGAPGDVIALIQAVRNLAEDRLIPKVEAVLYSQEALALAKLKIRDRCTRAITAAFRASGENSVAAPPWNQWIDDLGIDFIAGCCALELNEPLMAAGHFENSRRRCDEPSPRQNVLYFARSAEAQLLLGRFDQALEFGHRAIESQRGIDSSSGQQDLRGLRDVLARHRNVEAVRFFLNEWKLEQGPVF